MSENLYLVYAALYKPCISISSCVCAAQYVLECSEKSLLRKLLHPFLLSSLQLSDIFTSP